MDDKLYESVGNYTKYKLVEMLIEKHKDSKLDNLNAIEQVADDVCNVLSVCGLKYYNELKGEFISLSSDSLVFIFNYDYGFDTLNINARLKCSDNYLTKVTKCFFIGSVNNTGRYIKFSNFYKYLNKKLIIKFLEVIYLKKRH